MSKSLLHIALCAALAAPIGAFAQGEPPQPRSMPPEPPLNTNAALVPAGKWAVSAAHTQVVFSVMHHKMSPYYGRIERASGSLDFNPQSPEKSRLTVEMKLADLSLPFTTPSGIRLLNETVCKPEALDCGKYPTMTFISTSIKKTGTNTGDITGNFTMKGVTKPVTLHATFHGSMTNPMGGPGYVMGFSANGVLKRSDFGANQAYWDAAIGDDVNLLIEAEFTQGSGGPPGAPAGQ